ncbi:AsmA family protein [Chitinophaga japonensis]|nr:hypothetical protein [Chitinophaga japonensis]
MQQPSNLKKYIKRTLIIIGMLALIMAGVALYLSQRWSNTLRSQLKEYVTEMSDSLYTLRYDGVHLNILSGSLTLDSVSLVRDTAVYQRLQATRKAPTLLYAFSADRVALRYFKVWRYFFRKEVSAGTLVLQNPSIVLEQNTRNVDTSKHRSAYEHLSSRIRSLHIGTLLLDSSNLKYTYIKKDSGLVVRQLHNLSIHVKDLLIDSVAMEDPSRFLYARNYQLYLRDYRYRTPDSLYWMIVRDVSYDAAERSLRVGQFSAEPRYSPADFDKKVKVQRDRFDVELNTIVVNELQPDSLLQKQQIRARKVDIGSGTFNIYHNRSLPMSGEVKTGQYPHQLLQKLALPVMVDSLIGNRVDISYTEINPKSQEAGTLHFKQVHGVFRNITNMKAMIAKNSHCIADMDGVFMKSGKLQARFDFFLDHPRGGFAVSGQLKDMDGRELTPITRPLGLVDIRSANIKEVSFHMQGDEKDASGEVKMIYDNLRISILKKDNDSREIKRKGLLSLFANAIAINNSNPRDGKLHVAHPHFTRDPRKSFFNLVWKTLFTGVKEIAISGGFPI